MSAVPETPLRITPDMLLSRRVDFERRMTRVPPVTLVTLALLAASFVAWLLVCGVAWTGTEVRRGWRNDHDRTARHEYH